MFELSSQQLLFWVGTYLEVLIWLGAYLLAVLGSGPVVRALLSWAGKEIPDEEVNPGKVIGKLEDVLVISLVAAGAYTALALVFSAKEIVRVRGTVGSLRRGQIAEREDKDDSSKASYYVLGTLANLTWALQVGLLARYLTTLVGG